MKRTRVIAVLAVLCTCAIGAAAGSASASDASIRSLVKSYSAQLIVNEGHILSAIGEYKKTRNPSHVESALASGITLLRSLIAGQSAVSAPVKKGKEKLVSGLHKVISAYEKLKAAFAEKAASPSAALENAKKAEAAVKQGSVELSEGLKLLKSS